MKRMKSWWKVPNQTPAQVIAKRTAISKLIKEIDISEPDDDGIPFFGIPMYKASATPDKSHISKKTKKLAKSKK